MGSYAGLTDPSLLLISSCRSTRSTVAPVAIRSLHVSRVARDEQPSTPEQPLSPKLATIVDSISGLTLLEVSELVTALKVSVGACWIVGGRTVGSRAEIGLHCRTSGAAIVRRWEPATRGEVQLQRAVERRAVRHCHVNCLKEFRAGSWNRVSRMKPPRETLRNNSS